MCVTGSGYRLPRPYVNRRFRKEAEEGTEMYLKEFNEETDWQTPTAIGQSCCCCSCCCWDHDSELQIVGEGGPIV